MQPLFQTSTVQTYEEYRRCNLTLQFRVNHMHIKTLVIMLCVCGIAWLGSLPELYITAAIAPLLCWWVLVRQGKKNFESAKNSQGVTTVFSFYDTCLVGENKFGTSRIEYTQFFKKIETKTNFYLLLARNQSVVIVKDNCSEELISFIRTIPIPK